MKTFWLKSSRDKMSNQFSFRVFFFKFFLCLFAGEACIEKPLATLWRNYTQNNKPEVLMRLRVCPSGLKATTRQHGLTEYWSHRVTFCSAPRSYPKIFCWIYRHEGRKLKHELRCHAVICSKDVQSQEIASTLKVSKRLNIHPEHAVTLLIILAKPHDCTSRVQTRQDQQAERPSESG